MTGSSASRWAAARAVLVATLEAEGIDDRSVLAAIGRVSRERFVPDGVVADAYANMPLPIGHDQTISQPYMVAAMTAALALSGEDRVLEIGTGCGYQSAVLSLLCREVISVERIAALAQNAEVRLTALGYDNVHVVHGDGTLGWPKQAPYDAILVTAGASHAPQPLLAQLAEGGKLVIPEGDRHLQTLYRYRKVEDVLTREPLMGCRFVPLIGTHGWGA